MNENCKNNFYTNDELSYILKYFYDNEVFKSKNEIKDEKSTSEVIERFIEKNNTCCN